MFRDGQDQQWLPPLEERRQIPYKEDWRKKSTNAISKQGKQKGNQSIKDLTSREFSAYYYFISLLKGKKKIFTLNLQGWGAVRREEGGVVSPGRQEPSLEVMGQAEMLSAPQ